MSNPPTLENADCLWAARRLQEVTSDIQVFFGNQIGRLATSLEACERAVAEGEVVQNLMVKLKREQTKWEAERDSEIQRLSDASRRLEIEWERLESARREFLLQESGREAQSSSPRQNVDAKTNKKTDRCEPSGVPKSSQEMLSMIEDLRNEIHSHAKQKQ